MVCENLPCLSNGFLRGRDKHVELEIQIILSFFSIAFKGSSEKHPNRNLDPVLETIPLSKVEAVNWVKVSLE